MAQVTVTLDLGTTIKATLRDGAPPEIVLSVSAPYGDRQVSVHQHEFPADLTEAARQALQALVDQALPGMIKRAQAAAHEATAIALRNGEAIK